MVGALNYFVDPYEFFGRPRIVGLNAIKPTIGPKFKTSKIYRVIKMRPKSIIIGNSQLEMGLSPEHSCWPENAQPVFTIAVPGLSIYRQLQYGQHTIAESNVRLIVIGLDFLDFLVAPEVSSDPVKSIADYAASNLLSVDFNGKNNLKAWKERKIEQLKAAFSLNSLKDSILTIALQGAEAIGTRTVLGFNPAADYYTSIIETEGVGVLFTQKNKELAVQMLQKQWSLFHSGYRSSADFEVLKYFLYQVRQKEVKVVAFINPYVPRRLFVLD